MNETINRACRAAVVVIFASTLPLTGAFSKEKKKDKKVAADTLVQYKMDEIVVTATRIGFIQDLSYTYELSPKFQSTDNLLISRKEYLGVLRIVALAATILLPVTLLAQRYSFRHLGRYARLIPCS